MSKFTHSAAAGLALLACSAAPAGAGITSFNAAVDVSTGGQGLSDSDADSTLAFGPIDLAADARSPYEEENPAFSPTAFVANSTATGAASASSLNLNFTTGSGRDAPNGFSPVTSGFYSGSLTLSATIEIAEPTPYMLTAPTFGISSTSATLDAGLIRFGIAGQAPLVEASAGSSPTIWYDNNAAPGQDPRFMTASGVLQPGIYELDFEFRTSAEAGGGGFFSGFSVTVPEPASAAMILPAGLALLARRRRRA